jgi:hypothetical protein
MALISSLSSSSLDPSLMLTTNSWEFPGMQGAGSNQVSPDDSTNFLSFLQQLRKQMPKGTFRITADVQDNTFMGSNGKPMSDVSGFASVLDYIGIDASLGLSIYINLGHHFSTYELQRLGHLVIKTRSKCPLG